MAVLKLTGLETMTRKTTKVKQSKSYPTASVLYCTYANLPDSLSNNALIFTTDTAELFVGTGTGIQKLKLGSEEDLDPRIYLKIAEAKDIYQTKLQAEAVANEIMGLLQQLNEGVYSKEEIDKFITEDVDLDGVIDKLNTYTVDKINEILETKAMSTDVYTREQANEKLSTLKEELQGLISTLSSHVDSVQAALETTDTDNKTELEDLVEDTKTELEGKISTVSSAVESLSATHSQDVTTLTGNIAVNTTAIETLQGAVESADSELDNKISAVSTEVQTLATKHDQDIQDVADQASAALALKAQDLEGAINTAQASVESQLNEAKEALEASIAEVSANLTTLQNNVYTKDEVNELVNAAIADVLEAITSQFAGQ